MYTLRLCPISIIMMIRLFFDFAQLKNLYRQGWPKRGVAQSHCESVADHSFSVALLGYVLAHHYRPDLDHAKVMALGLIHELGEIDAGDITPLDNMSDTHKSEREYASVRRVFSGLADSDRYVSLWLEFENRSSLEAKFVGQVDRLEMALQACLYERLGYTALEDFFPYVRERITDPCLMPLLEDMLRLREG